MRAAVCLILITFISGASSAHPGAAIAVGKDGTVYFVDTGGGVFSIDATRRVARREGPAFHWFAFDPEGRFRKTPWPRLPGAEFRAAGVDPTIVLSSDYPVTIAPDGKFYYPDGTSGERVNIVAIDSSGVRTTRATLPTLRRGRETIFWINGLTAGSDGSLYYTEDRAIRKIDRGGRVTAIVTNIAVPDCAAVPGIERATGPYLRGLAIAEDGSFYVAASGCGAVLRIDANGRVSSALKAIPPWSPTAVAVARGEVYVLEYLHTASDNRAEWLPRIRKISKAGLVTTLGGSTRK